jgi:hypothetical protein
MMHGKLLVLGRGGGGGGGKIGRNERAEGGTKGELKENDTGVTNAMHTPTRYTSQKINETGQPDNCRQNTYIPIRKKQPIDLPDNTIYVPPL